MSETISTIVDSPEAATPPHYVSVYHETTATALADIAEHGLSSAAELRNIGGAPDVARMNELFDGDRPDHLITLGISRVHNTFAYDSLERGFSLGFAARRYVRESDASRYQRFEAWMRQDPGGLTSLGVHDFTSYERLMKDPRYLRQTYPGEVLELKVDPLRTFVGDLAIYTDIVMDLDTVGRAYQPGDATPYWQSIMTLGDFRKWYTPQEIADEDGRNAYAKHIDAPQALPSQIVSPEILIPDEVLPANIRVLP